jgi:PPE-repeat protein
VSTSYSVSEFKVVEAGVLDGRWSGSASDAEVAKARDGVNVKDV